ncbi:MAG TPA: methyltransferase domain-containing protein [archaeon]|nr:methyltransferase domain-containing protein [archaeon]
MQSTETDTFYDQHPFDWVRNDESEGIRATLSPALVELIESLDPGSVVLDLGCGPGRVLGHLARRGVECIGLDRSRVSVNLAVQRFGRPGVVGDNLQLPFAEGSADVVISDGVIHHTEDPQRAFAENCRVLKPGGQMYLAVYKPRGRYPWLYKYPGEAIRRGLRHAWARPLVLVFARLPYFLVHFFRSKGRRTWTGAGNLFYDYFVTPRVTFLPRETVEEWARELGVSLVRYDPNRGANVHSFRLAKEQHRTTELNSDQMPATKSMAVGLSEGG